VTGYLELSWRDPRLAVGAVANARPRATKRVDAGKIWTPRIFFENALEQPSYHHEPAVEVDDRGVVTSFVILTGKFSAPMNLRQFPFDRQVLGVRIGPFEDESVVKFVVKPEMLLVSKRASATDWTIEGTAARVESHVYVAGEGIYSRYENEVSVARRATFYVWRVMLPLTLLVLVSWAVFWFEPAGLQPQISTCMASLIALVAFNFTTDFSLPKVAYLTLIDKHALIGFGFVSASVVLVTLIHVALTRNHLQVALSIQRVARWAFPAAYLVFIVISRFT
jgi:hypothetical protein